MRRWHIFVSIGALALFGFLLAQDSLARLALRKYNSPATALALVRRDANLAMWLGSYYFGGTIGRSEYDLEKAERAYLQAVAVNPKILWGHYQLGRIYFVKGDYDQALEEINAELAANTENLRALYVRGLIYGYRAGPGDLGKAADDFQRFTQWAPKEWGGYNDLAWILSRQGKYKEAKEAIFTALREVPDAEKNPWLWNALGVSQLNLNEYDQAAASFGKAQTLADKLAIKDWRHAYPGNDPQQAEQGLLAFREAIRINLERARGKGE